MTVENKKKQSSNIQMCIQVLDLNTALLEHLNAKEEFLRQNIIC